MAEAVMLATQTLFNDVQWPAGAQAPMPLVVDPLIDGNTWAQTRATHEIEASVLKLVRERYPRFQPEPFSSEMLARGPIVFIGTFTPLDRAGRNEGPTEWYRICLALLDLRSGRIISKGYARAATAGVDDRPSAFFQDSPGWAGDEASSGYVRTCQGTRVGDPIQPAYWDRIAVAAVVNDAIGAYNDGHYEDALDLYRGALRMSGGDQLRVRNGIYLAAAKLKRRAEAAEAFGELVDYGLKHQRLGVKLLFRPGSQLFVANRQLTSEYAMWLRQIANHAAATGECLVIGGHTSRSGSEPLNVRLSLQRAELVRARLLAQNRRLNRRLDVLGYGSSRPIAGTGTDDARDALDRRVDFQPLDCSAAKAK
ncbi:MAG: OmpA family protein [Burkholderiales bacterium]|nr:OmpA family protein [Burkholderiales bacterium]MDE2503850.1 OmpA family protein [Burkholderiales bacterium]